MRLYTTCKTARHNFYVHSDARVRRELPPEFYLTCPYNHINIYYPREILAETTEANTTIGGALAGGIVGLLAGGFGAIVGVLTGGLLGGNRERQDIEAVNRFNNSV